MLDLLRLIMRVGEQMVMDMEEEGIQEEDEQLSLNSTSNNSNNSLKLVLHLPFIRMEVMVRVCQVRLGSCRVDSTLRVHRGEVMR